MFVLELLPELKNQLNKQTILKIRTGKRRLKIAKQWARQSVNLWLLAFSPQRRLVLSLEAFNDDRH